MLNNCYIHNMPKDSPINHTVSKGDSGATNHYICLNDVHFLSNQQTSKHTQVTLPNNETMSSTFQGSLNMSPMLSSKAQQALVLPNLKSSSLTSLGQSCDDDCQISLNKKDMRVCKDDRLVMKGCRNLRDGLWDVPIKS